MSGSSSPDPSLPTLGPYLLVRKLGQGGMGQVFLARDPRLGREVALKMLPEDLVADPERRSRFLREARAAAALKHPNITTIYEVGEDRGRDYIAFEYVEGPTLEERLAQRALGLSELAGLAVPLADALAYAHARGVVHRDLKAANVMLTERGLPKLLDFGLAKVLHESLQKQRSTTLTLSGAIFGTPAAMSPEQALGRTVDERSDVFSFGSLLYEMASGRPAFGGATVMETMDAVIHAEPEPLGRLRRDLPADFLSIVAKALRKDPAERYQHMADLAADLRHFQRKTDSALVPPGAQVARRRGPWLAGGLALALLLAAILWTSTERTAGPEEGRAGSVDLARAAVGVIGFENLSDPRDEHNIGRMLMGLITTDLTESGGLDVISTPRILAALREVGPDPARGFASSRASEAAERAGVQVMVVGQLAQRGTGLLLTAELVDVGQGRTLGSWKHEADEAGLFELAGAIGDGVRARLDAGSVRGATQDFDLARTLTSSPEAYRRYAAGEIALHELRFADASTRFSQAIQVDPSFALAYYRLGMAEEWQAREEASREAYRRGMAHVARLPDRWQGILRAALARQEDDYASAYRELTRIEPRSAELADFQNLMGEVLTHDRVLQDPVRSRRCFERALELDPTFKVVLYHLVQDCIRADDAAAVEALLARYRALDPRDEAVRHGELTLLLARGRARDALILIEGLGLEALPLFNLHALALFLAGEFERAEAFAGEALARLEGYARNDALRARGAARLARGRIRAALEDYRASCIHPDDSRRLGNHLELALVQGALGSPGEACATIRAALPTTAVPYAAFWLGHFLCAAGKADEAATLLAELRSARDPNPSVAFWEPLLACEVELARGEHSSGLRSLERAASAAAEYHDRGAEKLVRARLEAARGERTAAIAAYREILAPAYLRTGSEWNPDFRWRPYEIPVLGELARLEEQAGELDSARAHYAAFLAHWGEADVELPGVEHARASLARLAGEGR